MGIFGRGLMPVTPQEATYVSPGGLSDPYAVGVQPQTNVPGLSLMGRQPEQGKAWKPSFLGALDRVLGGGMTFSEARNDQRADHDAELSLADRRRLMAEVLKDPRERLAFLSDPKKWAEQVGSNFAAANVNGGDTRVMPGYGSVTAPKMEMSGDSGVVLTPNGMQVLGQRPMSAAEDSAAEKRQTDAELARLRTEGQLANWQAQQGVARSRLGLAQGRELRGRGGGGHGGPPPLRPGFVMEK